MLPAAIAPVAVEIILDHLNPNRVWPIGAGV